MKRSFLIFIMSACVQSQAWSFDPAVCTSHLEGQALTPIMLEAPMSRVFANSSPMYTPVQVIACKNFQNEERRFFPADQFFQKCTALKQQDPAWNPANGYTCVGTGIFEE